MVDQANTGDAPTGRTVFYIAAGVVLAALISVWPGHAIGALSFVLWAVVDVAPLVIPGILLAAWIIASSADAHIARGFEGRMLPAVFMASAIGAITPVCGVTVLPLMAGLLAAGVPLAPIMAFWLSSPITDPAMLATTAATLGFAFAVGKTAAAFGLGIFGGTVSALFSQRSWSLHALRDNGLTNRLSAAHCGGVRLFEPRIWNDAARRQSFLRQLIATTRLILICLIPAFAAEYALNAMLTPGSLAVYVGRENWWAIPAAVFVGAPAYIDGYAALPLTRGLIDNGMSQGAAMAFLVSGGVVSIWGAIAIFPVLKLRPFILYLALAVTGSMVAGYMFEWAV
ncbi:MAG TPA: permease [Hyphomicrobiales bacterium]|nr:permease [Hyphomicrobiales bacterium]